MARKKQISVLCLTCIVAVFLIAGLLLWKKNDAPPVYRPAESYEDLVVSVDFPEGEQTIKAWLDTESGGYFFFLPASSDKYDITFPNLGADGSLQIGERLYGSKDIFEDIKYKESYEMQLKVAGEVLAPQQLTFMKSENLPSMFIETESKSLENIHESKEVKEQATITLLDKEGFLEYDEDIAYIKCRGNSSFDFFYKKPYQIRLLKESSLLGMPSAEKWILLANAIDSTLLKGELVFRFAENYTSVPSIKGEYVDLYLNGEYAGNYYLCEKIEIAKNKIDITDLEAKNEQANSQNNYENPVPYISESGNIKAYEGLKNPADITGGYLVEHTRLTEEMPENSFVTDGGHCYKIVSPEYATVEQAEYICGLFNELEVAIGQEDGVNPDTGKHFSEYIDIDSWAMKYAMEEVFHDPDAMLLSAYFYKDADSVDSLIYSGPMWDYDRALGSYGGNLLATDSPEQVKQCGIYVEELMKHPEVSSLVYEKFSEYMVPYVEYMASADIYRLHEKLEASAEMNELRWKSVFGYYNDPDERMDYLIAFLQKKVDYLEAVWLDEDTCEVVFLDYYGKPYVSYAVKKGECLEIEPQIASWEAIFNGWYSVDGGIPFSTKLPIYSDVTYQADWLDMGLILQNGLSLSEMDVSQLEPETFEGLAEAIRKRQAETE